ncbi:probable tetraacyldisaccharide 4'-kinase, mitochondrial isoform X2 [Ananas comosus]|uniref:tetraacyldisaccharide 4'-kinase n=1 Tax=Ananas comosus TaxID=4615 RepID=A0A6P5FC70_ANACO|nr:probable tetraacyldisaccharide 4'-kinase, mitochondrial isoform X2 [Ananas comosus]
MEFLKRAILRIASTPDARLSELPRLHRRLLLPILSSASALYRLSLLLRRCRRLLLSPHRLPVPVISVGNVTWGGNGKTPMVELIARFFDECGVAPLVLTRGYAGGDEAKMLKRHLQDTSAIIGIGANRAATAASLLNKHGYTDACRVLCMEDHTLPHKFGPHSDNGKVGVVILDDGMQHWSLLRNVEIVMVNSMMPWGNSHLIPRGPLREPLSALGRADILVIHHADLVSDMQLKIIESTVLYICATLPMFFSRLVPSHLFGVKNPHSRFPLTMLNNSAVLCVSGIGFPYAFFHAVRELGPLHVGRLDFLDHHPFKASDIQLIREKAAKLAADYNKETVVVVTEKDYDRNPHILGEIDDINVLVLCSSLQIMPLEGKSEDDFRMKLKELLIRTKSAP